MLVGPGLFQTAILLLVHGLQVSDGFCVLLGLEYLVELLLQRTRLAQGPEGLILVAEDDILQDGLGDAELDGDLLVQLSNLGGYGVLLGAVSYIQSALHRLQRGCLAGLGLRDLEVPRYDHLLANDGPEHQSDLGGDLSLAQKLFPRQPLPRVLKGLVREPAVPWDRGQTRPQSWSWGAALQWSHT